MQVEQLPMLLQHVDAANYERTCVYLLSMCSYLPPPDDHEVLQQVKHLLHLPILVDSFVHTSNGTNPIAFADDITCREQLKPPGMS